MGIENQKTGGFVLKQRAFLKLYLLEAIEKQTGYGLQFLDDLRQNFKEFGYIPSHSELYKTLHKLEKEKIVKSNERIKGNAEEYRQKIVEYRLTDKGKEDLEVESK